MPKDNLVIQDIFNSASEKFRDRIALQIKKDNQWQQFTYQEIKRESLKVAAFLIQQGYKRRDFAVLILENRPEWVEIYLGIIYAGLTCVPLSPELTPQEIRNLVIDSGAKVIFCSEGIFNNRVSVVVREDLIKTVVLEWQPFKDISLDNLILPQVSPEDPASLIYTSGTTAFPKGVLLSHKNICSNFRSIEKLNLIKSEDNFLSILPLYHAYSFMVTLIVPLFLGAKVTYAYSFKPQELTQIINEAGITILVGVPQLLVMLYRAISERIKKIPLILRPFVLPFIKIKVQGEFKGLRFIASGGARLEPKTASGLFALGLKIVEGYGLTETSPVVTFNPLEKLKFGSVGRPIPGVEVRINNPDSSGIGEVIIRGDNVMQGYFKRTDLTQEKIKGGWLYSGDFGYLDNEGYLILTGRREDLIVLGSGKNIYPEELEEYYLKAPSLKEICIVPKEGEVFGQGKESLFAVVVPNLEFLKKSHEVNLQARIRWDLENLSRNLPAYKHIMGFILTTEELPRTPLKKIKRYQVKEKYLKETQAREVTSGGISFSKEDESQLNIDFSRKVIEYISGEVKKPVSLESHLEIDLGLDSLAKVELGSALESLLKLKIPDELLYSVSTIRELLLKLQDLSGKISVGLPEAGAVKKSWSEILKETQYSQGVKINLGVLDKLLTLFFKSLFLFAFRIFYLLRIEGRRNLPKEGPYLVCPNHASYLDGLFIFSSLPIGIALQTYFLGYNFIFKQPWIHWAVKIAKLVSIDTSTHLTEAMQTVSFLIKHKKIVCIFPEGTRSIDTGVKEFKKGVGILIRELDIPVVPAYIKGSHYTWPRGSLLPRLHPVKVIFGKCISLGEGICNDYEIISRKLQEEVLKLTC